MKITIKGRPVKTRHLVIAGVVLAALAALVLILVKVFATPNISDISPDRGPSTGGNTIIITGSGFTDYSAPITPVNFAYTGGCATYPVTNSGIYRLETWGAQGGNAGSFMGGRGGYSVGDIRLTAGTSIFVCVGGAGSQATRTSTSAYPGGFNGGGGAFRTDNGTGRETASGGGGTDIRVGINSLWARAIVAGGGGGAVGQQFGTSTGGSGGGLVGQTATDIAPGGGGTQTLGGINTSGCTGRGSFGMANSSSCPVASSNVGGGGGGWFGGGVGLPGGGGSGFLFGPASNVSSSVTGAAWLLNNTHYLSNARTIDGNSLSGTMPAPSGGTQIGQLGNGYAKITPLPYDVTIDGQGCTELEVLSDTQIRCVVPAHSAGPADVVVRIESATATDVYTYTDKLAITGPTQLSYGASGDYTVSMDYNFTGTFTLSDGGIGGTFNGPAVSGGNQLQFNGGTISRFTYIPPTGFQGDVTLLVDSGVGYITNAEITATVSTFADSFTMECDDTFVVPGMPVGCRITLNGIYAGTIDLADLTGLPGGDTLGGLFTSSDPRFSGTSFTTTAANTTNPTGQVLEFTYTSPDWDTIMNTRYDGSNGYYVFWPVITVTTSPLLTSPQGTVSIGLLAQAYEIFSIDMPPIDSPGGDGCVGCAVRFGLSTYNAPYFGTITLDSEVLDGGILVQGGTFSRGGGETATLAIDFNGSGGDTTFRYTPNKVGDDGMHTVFGTSSVPAIDDSDITFHVINSHIIITCDPSYIKRGGDSVDCTLIYFNDTDVAGSITISLEDWYISFATIVPGGDGIIVDTTPAPNDSTFSDTSGYTFTFCTGGSVVCPDEDNTRTFTYSLPSGAAVDYSRVRVQGTVLGHDPADTNWAILDIVPDTISLTCSEITPDCEYSRVGLTKDYILQPNGVFTGKVQLSDGDPNSYFSDDGIASWDYQGTEFDFEYRPASKGVKTLTATVIEVDGDTGKTGDCSTGVFVGCEYTMTVYVLADQISILGPDLVAKDETPVTPRFSLVLNGPFEGDVEFALWDDATNTIMNIPLAGDNIVSKGGGVYVCTVSLGDLFDPAPACTADLASASGLDGYNYLDIRATVPGDEFIADTNKIIGIVADDYAVMQGGMDATIDPIYAKVGTPLSFSLVPNALFAGTYSYDDGGAAGYFIPGGSIVVTEVMWPPMNDQTPQTQDVLYVPMTPGIVTLTFDAVRSGVPMPPGAEALGERTVTLIVMSNDMTIEGPSSMLKGTTETFTLKLNGPYDGITHIDESPASGIPDKIQPSTCVFAVESTDPNMNVYDSVNGESTCDFTFTSNIGDYANTVMFYASDENGQLAAWKTVNLIASDFSVVPGPELINQKINNPINFTVTPNAQFDGDFTMEILDPSIAAGMGLTCVNPPVFDGTFDVSSLAYSYSEYASVGQNPISKQFIFTPHSFGEVCVLVTPEPSDSSIVMSPQIIQIHVSGWPVIGGPSTIPRGEVSDTYYLTFEGDVDTTMNLTVWDPFTNTQVVGAVVTRTDKAEDGACTFTNADVNLTTNLTICTFTFELPSTFTGNYIQIHADDIDTITGVESDTHDVAVVATDFTVSPDQVLNATIDTPITITVTPNALYAGAFDLSGDMDGFFNDNILVFSESDWPADQSPMPGKTFTFTPHHYGFNYVTVVDAAGKFTPQVITIFVMADSMSLSGPGQIQLGGSMTGDYRLTVNGPYDGTVDLYVYDLATSTIIGGATIDNGGSCTFTTADYEAIEPGATICDFTVTLPAGLTSKRVQIVASNPDLGAANTVTMIMASSFALSPNTTQTVAVGDSITFTITPDAISTDTFVISTNSNSTISPASVTFSTSDYPVTSNDVVGKTFTVTTTQPGVETITIKSDLGEETVVIYTTADTMTITGPSRIQKGTTSSAFTLSINGPYVGTATMSTLIPGGGGGSTSTTPTTCTFTLADYGSVTSGVTSCTFTVTVPSTFSSNWLNVSATAPGLTGDPTVAITAADFELTPGPTTTGRVGTPITFTIAPDQLFDGVFSLSDGGKGGTFSPSSITFSSSNWPTPPDQTIPTMTFTYTPTVSGYITITATDTNTGSSGIGSKQTIITVMANSGSITCDDAVVAPGDSVSCTLTIDGLYEGDVDLSLWRPGSGGGTDLTDTGTFDNGGTCSLTIAGDYNSTTEKTTCVFEVTMPGGVTDTNYLEIRTNSVPDLTIPGKSIGVAATDFAVTPATMAAKVGDVLTFNISPNGLFAGAFSLDDGISSGAFPSGNVVTFTSANWPASPSQVRYSLPFRYVPTQVGSITIDICSESLGCQQVSIFVTEADGGIDVPGTGINLPRSAVITGGGSLLALVGGLVAILIIRRRRNET